MQTAILTLLCVIIILLFLINDNILKIKNSNNNVSNNNEKELELFRQGARQNWITVNVCLYKMYTELEILDYDSLQNRLRQNIEELTANPKILDEWGKKYNDYLKDSQEI
jgi:hypothetical protein